MEDLFSDFPQTNQNPDFPTITNDYIQPVITDEVFDPSQQGLFQFLIIIWI